GLRQMAETLLEQGDAATSRAVAAQALLYAQSLDADLAAELRTPAPADLEELWPQLEEKNRADATVRLDHLYAAYLTGEALQAVQELDVEVILLASQAGEIHTHEWALALKETCLFLLKRVDLPREKQAATSPQELETLKLVNLLAPVLGATRTDRD